jgi:hypothetical protein
LPSLSQQTLDFGKNTTYRGLGAFRFDRHIVFNFDIS